MVDSIAKKYDQTMSNLEIYYIISIKSDKIGIQPRLFFVISFYKFFIRLKGVNETYAT